MPTPMSVWMDHHVASHPPTKFAASPNMVLITRTMWYVVASKPRCSKMDWLNSAMPEYTRPKTELERANTQKAGLDSASQVERSARCADGSSLSPSNCIPSASGTLRTTSQASGASTKTSTQPTADQAGRPPEPTTI